MKGKYGTISFNFASAERDNIKNNFDKTLLTNANFYFPHAFSGLYPNYFTFATLELRPLLKLICPLTY